MGDDCVSTSNSGAPANGMLWLTFGLVWCKAMDVFDSLLSKRLEERIHQLQVFRQQLELIQMRNEREIMAAKIKNDKIVDKMKR
jgi:hypothetical protein